MLQKLAVTEESLRRIAEEAGLQPRTREQLERVYREQGIESAANLLAREQATALPL